MHRFLLLPLIILLIAPILAACQPAASITPTAPNGYARPSTPPPTAAPTDPNDYARQWLDNANKKEVKITKVVAGNPKNHKADALWCVETDATTPEGQTYLVAIWRSGTTWSGAEMADGEYEWDLNGCPRS